MQNLSISCALVCLIVLGSAALVGAFGVCQHQISAVLITGVMYLLAGKEVFKLHVVLIDFVLCTTFSSIVCPIHVNDHTF